MIKHDKRCKARPVGASNTDVQSAPGTAGREDRHRHEARHDRTTPAMIVLSERTLGPNHPKPDFEVFISAHWSHMR